jgi:hypothetical protein
MDQCTGGAFARLDFALICAEGRPAMAAVLPPQLIRPRR